MNSGYLAAGYWRTTHAMTWRTVMRSLAQVLQTRHGLHALTWNYVPAHSGFVWNEAVDTLAKYAAAVPLPAESPNAIWEQWMYSGDHLTAIQWLWYYELMQARDPRAPPLINGHMTCTLSADRTFASFTSTTTTDQMQSEQPHPVQLRFKLATANVLTLQSGTVERPTIARQMLLMEQLNQEECTIVGVQETRHRHLVAKGNDLYHIFGHPASPQGTDGIQLWISKRIPIDDLGNTIRADQIRIVASDVNFIIAKLRLPHWCCLIITCRAPHSGRPRVEAVQFWSQINHIIQRKGKNWPLLFCGDTNAHLGDQPTDAVGTLWPSMENQAGQVFHEWLLQHDLFLPATFSQHHLGSEHASFFAPDGNHEVRIDYVALPRNQRYSVIESKIADNIDLSVHRCDHRAVMCSFVLAVDGSALCSDKRRPHCQTAPDVQDLAYKLQQPEHLNALHYSVLAPPWDMDPHQSATTLASNVNQALSRIAQPKGQWKRKWHLSETTWDLVAVKKSLYKQWRCMRKSWRFTTLQACFRSWTKMCPFAQACTDSIAHDALLHALPGWIKLQDHAVALVMSKLKKASAAVQIAVRQEDADFYQGLANKAAQTYSVEGLQGIWKRLRAVLPKNRAKTAHVSRDIDAELLQHFEQLEAGTTWSSIEHTRDCLQRNAHEQQAGVQHLHLPLCDLPTLAEVETLCLRQKPRKAPGPDGIPADLCRHGAVAIAPQLHSVLCKSVLHGIEPVDYKGGRLCALHKGKNHLDDATGYRGILLANSFAKIGHAWARQRLLPALQSRRTIGQIGGLPSQQTNTGVQMIRLHGIIGQKRSLSTATLFLDLRSAFHHMLRELVFSTHNTLAHSVLASFLDEQEFDLHQIHSDLDALCAQPSEDIPLTLRRFLHDLHQHTWFCLKQPDDEQNRPPQWTHTRRGTRPGSPMADIGFNMMLTAVMKELHHALMQSEDYTAGSQAMDLFVPPIAWMDDIAIPLAAATTDRLIPLMQYAVEAVHNSFRSRGLTLNLDPGKTEFVACYRGPGSVECRKQLFLQQEQPRIVVTTSSHILAVRVVSSYRHLGVRFAMDLDLNQEVSARVGAAHQAFVQMKKAIFLNKALPLSGRLALFQSLVLSRLLYGTAIWSEVSVSAFRKIDSFMIACYRRICEVGFWSDQRLSDLDFLQSQRLLPFRIFLAKNRLAYLQHVALHGITAHKALLLSEFETGKGWLFEVAQDLQWLKTIKQFPFEVPQCRADWISTWTHLRDCKPWKAQLHRAVLKHLEQAKIAFSVRTYHASVCSELERFGAQIFVGEEADDGALSLFHCPQCSMSFQTRQRLALHEFRIHGTRAQEYDYVQSEVCLGCLKTFHTTHRVVQHLRYRGNKCWDRLFGVKAPEPPGRVLLPSHLSGVHRLPAHRVHHGPLRPTSHHRERSRVRSAIAELHQIGEDDYAWWDPCSDRDLTLRYFHQFEACLSAWMQQVEPTIASFHNQFFAILCEPESSISEFLAARIFIHWTETALNDLLPLYVESDSYEVLHEAYESLLDDLPTWHHRLQMKHLRAQWDRLEQGEPDLRVPQPLTQPRAARAHAIRSDFAQLAADEAARKVWRWFETPRKQPPALRGPFYIIHLYSGRRREHDFQAQMETLLAESPFAWTCAITVISIDTAISDKMNVHGEVLWTFLLNHAREGRILAMLLGPPCETWSSARHEPILDPQGQVLRGPRPLRSSVCPWGISLLSLAELKQIDVGNALLLKGVWLSIPIALRSCAVLLEHPAPAFQSERASIWRTNLLLHLLRDGWLFRRHTFRQGRHGAAGPKPTTLLHAHCPIVAVLDEMAETRADLPLPTLIGKDHTGQFRTARAKEYPTNLSKCFAMAFWRRIAQHTAVEGCEIAEQFAALASRVDPAGQMLPDYQPMS